MRAIISFSFFVVLTFIIGALLAYPLKLVLDPVFNLAFRRYLNYATLISGLITCFIYLRHAYLSFNYYFYNPYCLSLVRAAYPPHMSGLLRETSPENRIFGWLNMHKCQKQRIVTLKPI